MAMSANGKLWLSCGGDQCLISQARQKTEVVALICEENERQWLTCKFLVNANRAARCWAVSTGPTRERPALKPPSWTLFLTVWSETCTPVACWRSFCRALAVLFLFLKGADTDPATALMPFSCPVQLSLCNSRFPGIYSMLLRLCCETIDELMIIIVKIFSVRDLSIMTSWKCPKVATKNRRRNEVHYLMI